MNFLLILMIFTLAHAQASPYQLTQSQCSDADVRVNKPQVIKDYLSTPFNQGSINWCYGYVTADLLTVETGSPLSVSHISSIFNKKTRSIPSSKQEFDSKTESSSFGIYQLGNVKKALQMAIEDSPICINNDLDLNLFWLNDIDRIHREYNQKKIDTKELCQTLKFYMPNLDYSLTNFMEKYLAQNINDDLEPILRKNCVSKIEIPNMEVKVINKPKLLGKNEFAKQVNEQLNSGKPLGISYKLETISKKEGLHSSTVIGRRWNKGRCEYNIRNTWGKDCSFYNKDIECNKNEGSFWVVDKDFFQMSLDFQYLK